MCTDIPTVLSVERRIGLATSNLIIIEVENLFNLGIHPKGESQKHK